MRNTLRSALVTKPWVKRVLCFLSIQISYFEFIGPMCSIVSLFGPERGLVLSVLGPCIWPDLVWKKGGSACSLTVCLLGSGQVLDMGESLQSGRVSFGMPSSWASVVGFSDVRH